MEVRHLAVSLFILDTVEIRDEMPKILEDYTKDELIEIIKGLKRRKKFGLVWEDKPEKVVSLCDTELPVIEEVTKKAISKSKDKANNIIIEGDNYHSLSVLNYTHAGKIDVIYIDPPYNTGSNDFIYNDRYVDKEDGYRHSKWLSFMGNRLRLAKSLLSKQGVIFISIDDNEVAQLKLLCNDIFDEQNFVGTITWEKRTKAQNTKTAREMFQAKTEYILVYKNYTDKIKFNLEVTGEKVYDLQDEKGFYRLKVVEEMSIQGMRGRQSMIFDINGVSPREGYQWKIGTEQIKKYNDRGDIEIVGKKVFLRTRPSDEDNRTFLPFWSHFFDKENYGTAEKGKAELSEVLGTKEHGFETVKPVNLIKKLLFHINLDKNETVLDFFAGSGTTGHAVMQLNKEDGGNRKFILCTNNESQIAENITYPRISNVIDGYKGVDGIPANVRYFKTSLVSKQQTDDQTRIELVARSTDMICLREDTFEMVFDSKTYKIFKNATHYSAIVFEPLAIQFLKVTLDKLNDDMPAHIYVFSLSNDTYESDFNDLERMHELRPIPESILEVYRRIHVEQSEGQYD
jgi:adenine-specific DNA-methyltransferase